MFLASVLEFEINPFKKKLSFGNANADLIDICTSGITYKIRKLHIVMQIKITVHDILNETINNVDILE